jgi:hypothetical protein
VSASTLARWVASGKLPTIKEGRRAFVDLDDVDKLTADGR